MPAIQLTEWMKPDSTIHSSHGILDFTRRVALAAYKKITCQEWVKKELRRLKRGNKTNYYTKEDKKGRISIWKGE